MPNRFSMAQKGLLLVLMLVVAELIFVSFLSVELHTLRGRLEKERHARQVVEHLNRFASAAQKTAAEVLKALPVNQQVRDDVGLGLYREQIALMREELGHLKSLLHDDVEGLELVRQLGTATTEEESNFQYLLQVPHGFIVPPMLAKLSSSGDQITNLCDRLMARYDAGDTEQSLRKIETVLALGMLLGLVANLIAIWFFARKVVGRISIISENMSRFAKQEELLPEQSIDDEIGDIDKAFHRLASALENASAEERTLVEHATDVVCSIDTKGTFLTVSQASRQQWGYEPDELIGLDVEMLIPHGLSSYFENLSTRGGQEFDLTFETRLTRKDQAEIDTLWSAHWSPQDGSLFCCVRDVTDSNRMDQIVAARETQLRAVIENMPLGIVTVDTRGRIKSANKIAQQFLSLDVAPRFETVAEYLLPASPGVQADNDSLLLAANSRPARFSIRSGDNFTGNERFVDVTSVRSQFRTDEVLVLLDDTTERHALEQMKSNLVSLLGGTLQKPLAEVQLIVSKLIEKQAFDEKRRARLTRINGNTNRLLGLLEQLLDVESLGVGKLVGEKKACQVAAIISDAVDATRDYAEQQQRIQLSWDRDACFGTVNGDSQRLVQVLINLISNAIKYSPGNTTVSISVTGSAGEVEIRIADQGRGVPEEMRESIFQPFVQTQSSDGRRGAGTGLGLSICKQIIEGHDGKIGVDGRAEGGSVFWVKLPNIEGARNS